MIDEKVINPCESIPKGVQTQRRRVFWKQNPLTARPKRGSGRWGQRAELCAAKPVVKRPRLLQKEAKWTLGDLNPRPSGCKPDALPTELSALVSRAVSLSLLSLHLPMTANQTQSMVASRSGPTPMLVHGTPTKVSSLATYC